MDGSARGLIEVLSQNLVGGTEENNSQWGEAESTWNCDHYCPIVPAPDDR
jgi:hypothetical protein